MNEQQQLLHQEQYKGYTINIVPDDEPQNPREWDNLGHMVCFHDRYTLGDSGHVYKDMSELMHYVSNTLQGVSLPLYLYDHSGITMSTKPFNDRFDSSIVGCIFVADEQIKEEFGDLSEHPDAYDKAEQVLLSEVQIYDAYLSGAIVGFKTTAPNGNEFDSCYGFMSQEDALAYAKVEIDNTIENEKHRKNVRRSVAPFASAMHSR